MIVVQIIGGLGNQLFQYAMGRALALRHQTRLRLDLTGWPAYRRPYALSHFAIEARPAGLAELQLVRASLQASLQNTGTPADARLMRCIVERNSLYDATAMDAGGHLYLEGYWQSPLYFNDCADQIRAEFQLREELSPWARALAAEMAEEGSVSLHVRRGDYVSMPDCNRVHGTCDADYFARAMAEIERRVPHPRYFIFSDDLPWARENIRPRHFHRYVDPALSGNDPPRDHEEMILMSRCHHHIVANSTFSWWGAWLNRRPGRQVVAPARWYASAQETHGLIPQEWTRL